MNKGRPQQNMAAYLAALWAFIFAVLHFVWAGGWYIGLNPDTAPAAFAKLSMWIYDVVVAFACLLAAYVALALALPPRVHMPRRILNILAWSGTILLVTRAAAGIIQIIYFLLTAQFKREPTLWVEGWFAIGALLFLAALLRHFRVTHEAATATR